MKYRCILFDLDGTLLDTIDDLADGVNYAMEKYGFPTFSVETVCSYVGNGLENLMTRCIPGGYDHPSFWDIYEDFRSYYISHCRIKTKPYNGIIELLKKLKIDGCKIAVISNKNDTAVKQLNQDFFAEYIPIAIGESANVRKKPNPDSVLKAMDELGCTAKDSIYIGDSEVDIVTAKNAGIPCITVTWGFRSEDFLKKHGAEIFAHTPDELYELL